MFSQPVCLLISLHLLLHLSATWHTVHLFFSLTALPAQTSVPATPSTWNRFAVFVFPFAVRSLVTSHVQLLHFGTGCRALPWKVQARVAEAEAQDPVVSALQVDFLPREWD